ncbi:MAG: DEAD/DEAH box helicase [Candidatus Microsaccharimonas sp.]
MGNITLSSLRTSLTRAEDTSSSPFVEIYGKVILRQELSAGEVDYLFRMMGIFSVYGDNNLHKMAYSMALNYGLAHDDFVVLESFAQELRYYPVQMLIRSHQDRSSSTSVEEDIRIDDVFSISLAETYKQDYFRSEQQYTLGRKVSDNDNIVVVAPTSYGKSHLMVAKAINEYHNGSTVCIIVPTKSLIAQTVSMVISVKGDRMNIITHPDMYVGKHQGSPFVAILTQERLLALLSRFPDMTIDYLFIDESHNLFKDEERSLTLSRAIIIARNRSAATKIDYFSPFIAEPDTSLLFAGNLPVADGQCSIAISEYMKIPRYYLWDASTGELEVFDQFTDRFYSTEAHFSNYYDLLLARAADKSIVYLNKPRDVEEFADALANRLSEVSFSEESKRIVDDACRVFSKYVHQSYNLIKLLRRGVVINHGKMPDIIKEHVEFLYRVVDEVRFIVTTSTLLEGVNVPASKLFLLNYTKGMGSLDPADFKNLAGRVGRYNIIFNLDSPNLELLAPEIYVVSNSDYMSKSANPRSFLKSRAKEGSVIRDDIENPLLQSYDKNDKQARLVDEVNILANIDTPNIEKYKMISSTDPLLAQTPLGTSCFVHNVKIFDVVRFERIILDKMQHLINTGSISDSETMLSAIVDIFLKTTYHEDIRIDKHKYGNWIYLLYKEMSIREIYKEVINQKTSSETSFSGLIARSVSGWNRNVGRPVYVGDIGSCNASGAVDSRYNKYVKFHDNTRNLMPSYAVALAKENLDNIENYIVPFIEILNDFSAVDESFYKRIKYSTDNDFVIALLRAGFDFSLAKLIFDLEDLRQLVNIEQESPVCSDKDKFIEIMINKGVSIMYINSAKELL